MGFLIRTAITAVAFYIAAITVQGIYFPGYLSLIIAAVVFGLVNAVVRPIIATLSLPLTVLTLGLFTLVINAAMVGLTALLTSMQVQGFWPAIWCAIVVWLVSWVANRVIGDGSAAAAR